jgi:opacity protein-like surface antigen
MRKIAMLLFLAGAGSAWGQLFEVWFNGGESLMSNKGIGTFNVDTNGNPLAGATQNDVQLGDGFRFSFRMALNNESHFGHEVQYAYSRTTLHTPAQAGTIGTILSPGIPATPASDQGMAIHQGGYNFLLYATKEGTRFRPFATGGVGFSNFVPPGSSAASGGGTTKFGVNYGGGIKVRLTSLFGARVDIRQYDTPKPFSLPLASGWLRQNEISAGFGVLF